MTYVTNILIEILTIKQVIFSQSSDLIERQSSITSSTEEVTITNNEQSNSSRKDDVHSDQFGVFKDFDFLEYESESVEVCIL